jgi:DNA replication protein DnaC
MVFQLVSRSWGEVFGDKVLATAILDRLLHYIKVISLRGDSSRLKDRLTLAWT